MDTNALDRVLEVLSQARSEVSKVIIGQERAVEMSLIAIFSRQHALIEGVPGVAKTLLVRTLARVLGASFERIQFTPDLMPTDITGTNVFNLQMNDFTLLKGPVFTSFLLADEINRAPAKTQSALLQAMQERAVSIDRQTYSLPPEFTVFATQNPLEFEGTYPLPEAQKDRFMLKIVMECPDRDDELVLAQRMLGRDAPEDTLGRDEVRQVIDTSMLDTILESLSRITFQEDLVGYVVDLARRTRTHGSVLVGAGPRATQALLAGSRVSAAIDGRDFVTPDDIHLLAPAVLGHRLLLRPEFELEGLSVEEVVSQIIQQVSVPR